MVFKAGKNTELWLDAVDVSEFFNDLEFEIEADTADTSTFKATYKTFIEGVAGTKVTAKGFYDKVNDARAATTLMNGGSVLTVGPGGMAAIGDLARLIAVHEGGVAESSPIGGAVLMTYTALGEGIPGFGWTLHPLGGDTNTTTGAERDDAAATSTGWRAHLHVISVTGGSWVVKLQDAAVSNTYTDLTGGAFTAATGATSQRLVGATGATLRRYVRYVATRTGGSAGDSITFGLAYSRN